MILRKLSFLLILFIPFTSCPYGERPPFNDVQTLSLIPIDLFGKTGEGRSKAPTTQLSAEERAALQGLGPLTFLQGWQMISENERLGGISAMAKDKDMGFLFITDAGSFIRFTFNPETNQLGHIALKSLAGGPRPPNAYARRNWDAESLIYDGKTKQAWIGFENVHMIWRYGEDMKKVERSRRPAALNIYPLNGGAEAMLRLRDGRFLIFAENQRLTDRAIIADMPNKQPRKEAKVRPHKEEKITPAQTYGEVILFSRDPTSLSAHAQYLLIERPQGYAITGAAHYDENRALLLMRKVSLSKAFEARIAIISLDDIKAGEMIKITEIAHLSAPLAVDNMEAIYVEDLLSAAKAHKGQENDDSKKNRKILWLASDNNFLRFQRNLLWRFEMDMQAIDAVTEKVTANRQKQ